MALSPKANDSFKRYSTGPLYSQRQLAQTEAFLVKDGFTKGEELPSLGLRVYGRPDGASASIYLDELKCDPRNSGIMFISEPDKPAYASAVWTFARERDIATTKNPLLRLLKKANPF